MWIRSGLPCRLRQLANEARGIRGNPPHRRQVPSYVVLTGVSSACPTVDRWLGPRWSRRLPRIRSNGILTFQLGPREWIKATGKVNAVG